MAPENGVNEKATERMLGGDESSTSGICTENYCPYCGPRCPHCGMPYHTYPYSPYYPYQPWMITWTCT